MNDPVDLNRFVRRVLAMRSDRRFTESMLFEGVKRLCVEPLEVSEFREAMEWNQARALIERAFNDDLNKDEWFLTAAGKAKEGLVK